MWNWLELHKPAASARSQLLLAAITWSVVGTLLAVFGAKWLLASHVRYVYLLLATAALLGFLKARFILGRAAQRTIERIRSRGDGVCIGGFFSPRTWAIVALMAAAGRILRGGLVPRPIVGFVYAAVGAALLIATRRLWRALSHQTFNG
jgi:hypothetical protein